MLAASAICRRPARPSLALVWAVGQRLGGGRVAAGAALLFACAPQATYWSLKVAGGHQVAVVLALAAILLLERERRAAATALTPFVAFAHPREAMESAKTAMRKPIRHISAERPRRGARVPAEACRATKFISFSRLSFAKIIPPNQQIVDQRNSLLLHMLGTT